MTLSLPLQKDDTFLGVVAADMPVAVVEAMVGPAVGGVADNRCDRGGSGLGVDGSCPPPGDAPGRGLTGRGGR